MKNTVLRIISLLLLCVITLLPLASCATPPTDSPDDPSNTPTPPSQEQPEEPEKIIYEANIPDGYSAGGVTFTVYTYPKDVFVWKDFDWQNEKQITSDRINDAVYMRSSQVEELLDITIDWFCGASYSDPSEFRTDAMTSGNEFSVGNITMFNHISMIQQGLLAELNSYGELDLDAPWWDGNLLRDLAILDTNFCLTGDIGTMYKRSIGAILFNKELMKDLGESEPYELIESREWTIEAMIELSENISLDIDDNGEHTEADRYGLIYFDPVLCSLEIGGGVEFAKMVDGVPEMTLNSTLAIDILTVAAELIYDEDLSYNVYSHKQNEETMWKMFMADQALFYYGELHSAEDMRSSESDFGIMPIPLYDEYQESYRHSINPGVAAVLVIPKSNTDATRTSYILDALGAASKNILTPAYYDLNLQGVVSRDEESTVSLDLIISTLAYDPGFMCVSEAGNFLRTLVSRKSTDFVSLYKTHESQMNNKIAALIEAIEENY